MASTLAAIAVAGEFVAGTEWSGVEWSGIIHRPVRAHLWPQTIVRP